MDVPATTLNSGDSVLRGRYICTAVSLITLKIDIIRTCVILPPLSAHNIMYTEVINQALISNALMMIYKVNKLEHNICKPVHTRRDHVSMLESLRPSGHLTLEIHRYLVESGS